jgi:diacylglycerol O-acyltransferase / wax synthase
VAIMSYNGRLDFGLLADYDAMTDLEDLALFLEDSLVALLEEARRRGKRGRKPKAKAEPEEGRTETPSAP